MKKRNIAGFVLDFGDGNYATDATPVHRYKKAGTYTVSLNATGDNGKKVSVSKQLKIKVPNPSFEINRLDSSKQIQFTTKEPLVTTYNWNFGDGTAISQERTPVHIYQLAGRYTVTLAMENKNGCKAIRKQDVVVPGLPEQVSNITSGDSAPVADSSRPVLAERETNIIREIETSNDSVSVVVYDNGEIDGDSVTLIYNGVLLARHLRLTDQAQPFRLPVDKLRQANELVMYAENLGSIPPNTAIMIIYDGTRRYEINISSNESINGAVRFRFKK